MTFSWNLSPVSRKFQNSVGSLFVYFSRTKMPLSVIVYVLLVKQKCSVCEIREGACIQCAKTSCFLAFHTTCARREKLLLPMKSAHGSEPVTLTCYCDKHLPVRSTLPLADLSSLIISQKEQQDIRLAALAAEAPANSPSRNANAKLSKSARAYAKTYKPGPPLVPAVIVERVKSYTAKVPMRKRGDFVYMLCRYWSLKREARRGAPLLKRLHLEPWTASAVGRVESDEEKRMKLEVSRAFFCCSSRCRYSMSG
jgi:hypothetical protein